MKIGILTFPGSPSHGAALQMCALYRTLREMGQDVEIINYIPGHVIHKQHKKRSLRRKVMSLFIKVFVKSSAPAFAAFEASLVKYPAEPIGTTEEMQAIAARYDRIIVGSDQVWNPVVTGNDMNYYLAFSRDDAQKASYAPSFGVAQVAEADREQIAALLAAIPHLCVREVQGAQIIKELTGREVPVVLDPTLLVDRPVWQSLTRPVRVPRGGYVLYYTIKPSASLKAFARQFAKKQGLRLVTIGGRLREFVLKGEVYPVSGIGPGEFLHLINSAAYVITNSFHGTALSIMLQKNFYVEYSSDTNSRLTNIVNTFGLEACVVGEDTLQQALVQVDYAHVESVLCEQRQRSLEYLKKVVSE